MGELLFRCPQKVVAAVQVTSNSDVVLVTNAT